MKGIRFKLPMSVSRFAGKVGLKVKAKSPEILFSFGVISFGAAIVSAIKASEKHADILLEHEELLDEAKLPYILPDECEAYTVDEYGFMRDADGNELEPRSDRDINREVRHVYLHTTGEMIKCHTKTFVFSTISLVCFGGAYKVLSGRVAAGLVTISSLQNYISQYEKRNIELNGRKSHEMCKYGYKSVVEEYTDPETGKTVTEIKNTPDYPSGDSAGSGDIGVDPSSCEFGWPPTIIFSKETTAEYKDRPPLDEMTLEAGWMDAIRVWRTRGWVCLNDALEYYGIPKTVDGNRFGKVYREGCEDHGGEPYFNIDAPVNNDARRGVRKSWILETNFTDDIFAIMAEEKKRREELEDSLRAKRIREEALY